MNNTNDGSGYTSQQAILNSNTVITTPQFTQDQQQYITNTINRIIRDIEKQKKEEKKWYQNLLIPSFSVIIASFITSGFTYCSAKIPQEYNVRITKTEDGIKELKDKTQESIKELTDKIHKLDIEMTAITTEIKNIKS